MICLTFRHWSWNLISETHQYQRIRHFSHWMPFECVLSFGVHGQVQKGTQEECRCCSLKRECWTLPLGCWLILDVSEAQFSSFYPPPSVHTVASQPQQGGASLVPNVDLGSECFSTFLLCSGCGPLHDQQEKSSLLYTRDRSIASDSEDPGSIPSFVQGDSKADLLSLKSMFEAPDHCPTECVWGTIILNFLFLCIEESRITREKGKRVKFCCVFQQSSTWLVRKISGF